VRTLHSPTTVGGVSLPSPPRGRWTLDSKRREWLIFLLRVSTNSTVVILDAHTIRTRLSRRRRKERGRALLESGKCSVLARARGGRGRPAKMRVLMVACLAVAMGAFKCPLVDSSQSSASVHTPRRECPRRSFPRPSPSDAVTMGSPAAGRCLLGAVGQLALAVPGDKLVQPTTSKG